MLQSAENYRVYENSHFTAVHAQACAIPGYLIVTAKQPAPSIASLSPEAVSVLGPTLALIIRAIEEVIQPEVVYCLRFGEALPQVHFHIFPRTKTMAEDYSSVTGKTGPINGPSFFDWAREFYQNGKASAALRSSVPNAVHALRELMRERPVNYF